MNAELQKTEETGGEQSPPVLRRLDMKSHMATSPEVVLENVRKCHGRELPKFHLMPEFMKTKGDLPLAIVAGGPSLKTTLDELEPYRNNIMVCGSAHDHVISLGYVPRYAVFCDPDPIMANYVRKPHPQTTYLLASHCNDNLFDALRHFPVAVWHPAGIASKQEEDVIYKAEPRIGGGCTVTLRAIPLAIMLGYSNQHFFGFDSCVSKEEHHAYDAEDIDKPIDVRVGLSGRTFYAPGYLLAQAEQFKSIVLKGYGHLFTPTIHGDGLIAEIMREGHRLAQEQAA
jgi:hypothetical protein